MQNTPKRPLRARRDVNYSDTANSKHRDSPASADVFFQNVVKRRSLFVKDAGEGAGDGGAFEESLRAKMGALGDKMGLLETNQQINMNEKIGRRNSYGLNADETDDEDGPFKESMGSKMGLEKNNQQMQNNQHDQFNLQNQRSQFNQYNQHQQNNIHPNQQLQQDKGMLHSQKFIPLASLTKGRARSVSGRGMFLRVALIQYIPLYLSSYPYNAINKLGSINNSGKSR